MPGSMSLPVVESNKCAAFNTIAGGGGEGGVAALCAKLAVEHNNEVSASARLRATTG